MYHEEDVYISRRRASTRLELRAGKVLTAASLAGASCAHPYPAMRMGCVRSSKRCSKRSSKRCSKLQPLAAHSPATTLTRQDPNNNYAHARAQ